MTYPDLIGVILTLFLSTSRFDPSQQSRGNSSLVGIYCLFLNLDVKSMRRKENIAVITLAPKRADLVSVMGLIMAQLRQVANGVPVMDLPNAVPTNTSGVDLKDKVCVKWTSCNSTKTTVEEKAIPVKTVKPYMAQTHGDSVGQIVLFGGRSVRCNLFCRYCLCNQGGAQKDSNVYDLTEDVVHYQYGIFH